MQDYLSFIENSFTVIGSIGIAVIIIIFLHALVNYIFFGGDDAHRGHAKITIINMSITLFFVLILWGICEWLVSMLTAGAVS